MAVADKLVQDVAAGVLAESDDLSGLVQQGARPSL